MLASLALFWDWSSFSFHLWSLSITHPARGREARRQAVGGRRTGMAWQGRAWHWHLCLGIWQKEPFHPAGGIQVVVCAAE